MPETKTINRDHTEAAYAAALEWATKSAGILVAPNGNQASCTFIENRGTRFFLTAGHFLEQIGETPNLRLFWHSSHEGMLLLNFPAIYSLPYYRGKPTKHDPDIGILQGSSSQMHSMNDVHWFDCTNPSSQSAYPGSRVLITGGPTELREPNPNNPQEHHCAAMCLASTVTMREEWGEGWLTKPHPGVDILIEYGQEELTNPDGSTFKQVNPQGMSGAPVLSIPPMEDGKLWSMEQAKLVGVQTGFHKGESLIRATRIEALPGLIDKMLESANQQ